MAQGPLARRPCLCQARGQGSTRIVAWNPYFCFHDTDPIVIIYISHIRKLRLTKVDWDSKSDVSDTKLLTLRQAFLRLQSLAELLCGFYHVACTICGHRGSVPLRSGRPCGGRALPLPSPVPPLDPAHSFSSNQFPAHQFCLGICFLGDTNLLLFTSYLHTIFLMQCFPFNWVIFYPKYIYSLTLSKIHIKLSFTCQSYFPNIYMYI